MLSAGLVELVEPEGAERKHAVRPALPRAEKPTEAPPVRAAEPLKPAEAPKPPAVKRNVILALIERIRRL
jgi:hypothetical protein